MFPHLLGCRDPIHLEPNNDALKTKHRFAIQHVLNAKMPFEYARRASGGSRTQVYSQMNVLFNKYMCKEIKGNQFERTHIVIR